MYTRDVRCFKKSVAERKIIESFKNRQQIETVKRLVDLALQLVFDQKLTDADLVDDIVELKTTSNKKWFRFEQDEKSRANHFKPTTTVPFKMEKKTNIFKLENYTEYEFERDIVEIKRNRNFDQKNSIDGQIIHIFLNDIKYHFLLG